MENRFKLLREEEETRRKDINPKAKFGQKELCEELEKMCGFMLKMLIISKNLDLRTYKQDFKLNLLPNYYF